MLKIRKNPQTEPGLPDFTGTVKEMRVFLRGYIGDPTTEGSFTNPEGKKLNPALLDWEEESNKRREKYFEEIKSNHNFTKIYHENKKMKVLNTGETTKEILKSIKEIIAEETDYYEKNDLLTKLNFIISSSKSEKIKMAKLKEFLSEIMDSISKDVDMNMELE